MNETIIKVEGMACSGCENRVQNVLKTIEGIESVIANCIDGTVRISAKNGVSKEVIKERIEDIGFKVKED